MAKNAQKDLLSRFADLGEEALHKLPNVPGGNKLMDVVNQSKDRVVDERVVLEEPFHYMFSIATGSISSAGSKPKTRP